jgi:hypothetical protein
MFGFKPESGHVGFLVDKAALGQVFYEYFGFPYQFALNRSIIIYYPGLVRSGRSTKWTQSHPMRKNKLK